MRRIRMKTLRHTLIPAVVALSTCAILMAQAPGAPKGAPGGAKAAPRPVLSVSSTAWPDGGEVPMQHAGRGGNKSPEFDFHWTLGTNPTSAPEGLQKYAGLFH